MPERLAHEPAAARRFGWLLVPLSAVKVDILVPRHIITLGSMYIPQMEFRGCTAPREGFGT